MTGRIPCSIPDAIADAAWAAASQPRNAWSHEIEVRPWVENF